MRYWIVLCICLAACAPQWVATPYNPDGTKVMTGDAQFEAAKHYCEAKATVAKNQTVQLQGGGLSDIVSHHREQETFRAAIQVCMAEKGYRVDWSRK